MKRCSDDCIPCCDFCKYVSHIIYRTDSGKIIVGGPDGCSLHKDKYHQDMAMCCGEYHLRDWNAAINIRNAGLAMVM